MSAVAAYLSNITRSAYSIFEGMAVTMSWMFRKPVTIQYPYHPSAPERVLGGPETLPERYRGFLEVDSEICTACLACERACPIACIAITVDKVQGASPEAKAERMMTRFDIDLGKCMYCGLCSEPCPTGAIRHTQHFEAATSNLSNLIAHFVDATRPVAPYKVVKGEEPKTAPRGAIIARMFVKPAN
jgi:NADH-quinone oxidoreductase subunit I/NAD(P)H-quinone oxidoreductase subunit I